MTRFEELILKYCPNGVEYKKIYTFADTNIGLATSVTAHKSDRGVQLLHNSDIQQNKIVVKKVEYIDEEFARRNESKIFKYHDIITVHTGDVGTSAVIEEEFVGSIGFTTITTHIKDINFVNPYYLSHYLNSNICKNDIAKVTISDRSNLNQKEFEQLEIPVPPLHVQEEIVRILDKFTELEAELEAELEMRKKQYEYYRDKMLSFEDYTGEIEYKTLNELATNWFRGNGIKRDEVTVEGQPCIRYGELYTTYGLHFKDCVSHTSSELIQNPKVAKKGTILFAITGESVEDIAMSTAYLGDEDIYVGGDILAMEHEQDAKYISYALSTTNARQQKSKGRIKSKVVHSNKNDISQIVIPVPVDLCEQRRIADTLDKFYNLINDMNEGIPIEIKLRRQQYEYYRDKLLSFDRLEDAI